MGRHKDISRKEAYKTLYDQGKSYSEIGAIYGVSKQAVQQNLSSYGVKSRSPGTKATTWDFNDYASIIGEMREVGRGVHAIANAIGIYPTNPSWDRFVEYVNTFPKYGGVGFRRCPACGITGQETMFYKNSGYCRKCHNKYQVEYRRKQKLSKSDSNSAS